MANVHFKKSKAKAPELVDEKRLVLSKLRNRAAKSFATPPDLDATSTVLEALNSHGASARMGDSCSLNQGMHRSADRFRKVWPTSNNSGEV